MDGRLRSRGSADSKLAAAISCHIADAVAAQQDSLTGTLAVLLDVDEHSGGFGGARAFISDPATGSIGGVMIGYSGFSWGARAVLDQIAALTDRGAMELFHHLVENACDAR